MTQNVLDKLENKYGFDDSVKIGVGDGAGQCVGGTPDVPEHAGWKALRSWKDSPAVCLLSGFMKETKGSGFTLYQTLDGYPILGRKPRFLENGEYDPQWVELQTEACFYMDHARADLARLIRDKKIFFTVLPLYEQDCVSNQKGLLP